MKRVLLAALLASLALSSVYSQVLWTEDFADETDGAITGTAAGTPGGTWSRTYGGGGTFSKQSFFGLEFFFGQSMGGTEGRWATNVIDISSYGYAIVDVTAYAAFTDGDGDYFEAYYILNNNGIEVPFYTQTGSLVETGGSAIVSGSQLQVVVRMMNDDFLDTWGIQDVTVTGITTLYSTNAGGTTAWDLGTTWSTTAFGGAVCSCTPNNLTRVLVGSGYSINIPTDSDAIYVEVQSGGGVSWSANADLNIGRGGVNIQTGATINSGVSSVRQIVFSEDNDTPVIVDGSLTIGDIQVNGSFTMSISGGGTILLRDDLLINNDVVINSTLTGTITITDDITITGNSDLFFSKAANVTIESIVITNGNDITFSGMGLLSITGDIDINNGSDFVFSGGAVSVGDDILFDATSSMVINTALTIADIIQFNSSNSTITNNSTTSLAGITALDNADDDNIFTNSSGATLNVGYFDTNNADFDIFNSGTINQTGNFLDINTADTNFNNLATGVWNWTLTPNTTYDTDMATVLDCSAVGNTFNYSGAGDQRIIPVQYGHLTLSGSGAKDVNNANISVNGNWTQSGATFTQGTGTVTFNGASAQAINNSNDNTFYNLTINKSAAANTVTMNNALTVSNTLTLTTGGLIMNGNALNITRNNTAAMAATANGYLVSESEAAAVVWNTRTVTGTFTFPFRNAAGGTAIAVTFNKTSAGTESGTGAFAVSTYGTGAANTPYPSGVLHTKNASGVDISANVADRFWVITPSGYSTVPNATVTFRVTNAERPTGTPSLVAQRWNTVASLWDAAIVGQTSTTTSAQVAIPGTFSAWALSDSSTPLPIELLSFEAQQSGNAVKLNWSTATELNNDFFTLERLNDADGFDVLLTHPGKGTTTEMSLYEAFDRSPRVGKNYYRLKQTDFDGQFSYSDIVLVEFAAVGELLQVYPNPTHRKPLNLEVRALAPYQSVPVVIHTALGTEAFRATAQADGQGYLHLEVPTTDWPTGLYLVQVGTETARQLKVIIE